MTDEELHQKSLNNKLNKTIIYDEWAETYENYVKSIKYIAPKEFCKILIMYNKYIKPKILDFGCGTGLLGLEISNNLECYLDGIDISNKMILKCKQKKCYDNIYNLNLQTKTLNKKYDIIVSCGVFLEGHVDIDLINKLGEILSNNGLIVFTIRNTYIHKCSNKFNEIILNNPLLKNIYYQQIQYLENIESSLIILKKIKH